MNRKLMVSTDVGVFCTPDYLKNLYGDGIDRVEVIGWLWAENFLRRLNRSGIVAERLHGRIGNSGSDESSKGLALLLQTLLMPTPGLIALGNRYGIGKILIHAGEAREMFGELKEITNNTEVCVENSLGGQVGLEAAFELASELKARGVKASVVGDIGHFGVEIGKLDQPEELVAKFIQHADLWEKKYEVRMGVHLPIHIEKDEGAIDIDKLSDETLERFLHRFDEVVVENRADLSYEFLPGFGLGYKDRTRQRWQRIRRLFDAK